MPTGLDIVHNGDGTYGLGGAVTDAAALLRARTITLALSRYDEPRGAAYVEELESANLSTASVAAAVAALSLPNLAAQLSADGVRAVELDLQSMVLRSPSSLDMTLEVSASDVDETTRIQLLIGDV